MKAKVMLSPLKEQKTWNQTAMLHDATCATFGAANLKEPAQTKPKPTSTEVPSSFSTPKLRKPDSPRLFAEIGFLLPCRRGPSLVHQVS